MLTAWGDESQSMAALDPGTYILAAALSFDEDLAAIRSTMERMKLPSERKMHWQSDSPARHRKVVDAISELPVEGFVVVRATSQDRAERSRRKCLEMLLHELHGHLCSSLTLESRGKADDKRDVDLVGKLRRRRLPGGSVPVFHEVGPKQPMLWIADAICGAVMHHRCGEPEYLARLERRVTVSTIDARC